MKAKEHLERLGFKGILALAAVAIVLAVLYDLLFAKNLVLSVLSLTVAVFGAYLIFASFEEEEKPLIMLEGEKPILKVLESAYVIFPKKPGGFMGGKTKSGLDVYLTSKRIVARKPSGDHVLDVPLETVQQVLAERRVLSRFLRVRYPEDGKTKDALLFVGNTDLWMERLAMLGVAQKTVQEEEKKDKPARFVEDAKRLKERISLKGKSKKR